MIFDFDFYRTSCAKNSGLSFSAMIILYIIVSFVGQGILGALFATDSFWYIVISSLFSVVSVAIAVLLFKEKNRNAIVASGIKKFNPIYFIPAIMLSVGMFLGLGFLNGLIGSALQSIGLKVSSLSVPLDSAGYFIIFAVTLALFPAVIEEAFFRGVLTDGLSGVRVFVTAVMVGLTFALYHCSATQFAYQFIYGFFLTLLTIKSASTIPAITAHFLNNFAVLLLTYLNIVIDFYALYIILPGLALIIGVFAFLALYQKKNAIKDFSAEKICIKDYVMYGSFGAVLCLLIMITGLFL